MSMVARCETEGPLETQSQKDNFVPIPSLKLQVPVAPGDTLLVLLSVPDTWNEANLYGAQFQITCDGEQIATGNYIGVEKQRIPVFLQAVIVAERLKQIEFEARWCMNSITASNPSASARIGSQKATLVVVRSA